MNDRINITTQVRGLAEAFGLETHDIASIVIFPDSATVRVFKRAEGGGIAINPSTRRPAQERLRFKVRT